MIGISAAVIAAAIVVLTVYVILTLRSVRQSLNEANATLADVRRQVDQITHETVSLMRNTNQIATDVQQKMKHVDALFESVGEIGQAVNQVTSSVKQVSATVTDSLTGGVQRGLQARQQKIDEAMQWVDLAFRLWRKLQAFKSNKSKGEVHNVKQ